MSTLGDAADVSPVIKLLLHTCNAIYKYQGYVFHEVEIIFSQIIIHYQHTFSNFAWDAVCWSRKIPCCSVGTLQARPCSHKGVLGVHSAGVHRDGIRRWRFIYRCGRTLLIRCFNFFNLYTFRSELIVTPLSKNSSNKFPSLSQKTLPATLPAEVCTLHISCMETPGDAPLIVFSSVGRNNEPNCYHW